jgi:uncharacterized membrane protein YhdT
MPDNQTPKTQPNPKERPESLDLSKTILGSSLQMIGVSLTVAGIYRGIQVIGKAPIRADNVLSGVAMMFLLAWIFAYLAQRSKEVSGLNRAFELIADGAFLIALVLTVLSVGLIAFEAI